MIRFFILISILILFNPLFTKGQKNKVTIKSEEKRWLSQQNEKGFVENKGQMIDGKGNLVPFVLFKTESSNINLYITEKGITIETITIQKELKQNQELTEIEKEEELIHGKRKTNKTIHWERIDMDLKGSTINRENILKEKPKQGHYNYFNPQHPEGIYDVNEYEKITIKEVYKNIDWVLYRKKSGELKYDFVVHSGGNYKEIELLYKSRTPIKLNKSGQLEFYTDNGNIQEQTPVSYHHNRAIKTVYKQNSQKPISINGDRGYETSITFQVDIPKKELILDSLIIDPQLVWGTFYGGSGDDGFSSVVSDVLGNIYITGYTNSTDFPVFDAGSGSYFQGTKALGNDIIILKFNTNGILMWATYYGGNLADQGASIALDANNNVIITGYTSSSNFPVLNPGGGYYFQGLNAGGADMFVLKFNTSGILLWGTFYGGSGDDRASSIVIDDAGNIIIAGHTISPNFPTLNPGGSAFSQPFFGGVQDIYITKFNNLGTLLWSTYYGGNANDQSPYLTLDTNNNLLVTGITASTNLITVSSGSSFFQGTFGGGVIDAFILKFNPSNSLIWATYYGGNANDMGMDISADANNNVIVTGSTNSTNIPILNAGNGSYFQGLNAGNNDLFILKFDNNNALIWGTYFGGSNDDNFSFTSRDQKIAIATTNDFFITGYTNSTNFPTLDAGASSYFQAASAGANDIFILNFNASDSLIWSTYSGTNNNDFGSSLTITPNNCLFAIGEWQYGSTSNGTLNPGGGAYFDATGNGDDDSYVMKFCPTTILASFTVSNPSLCVTDCVDFTDISTGNSSVWSWHFFGSNTPTSSTQNPSNICYSTPGNYDVALVVSDGINQDSLFVPNFITVNPLPIVTANSTATTICSGAQVTLTGGGGSISYTWDNGVTEGVAFTPIITTLYTVTGTDANACLNSDTITVNVISCDLLTASFTPSTATICQGEIITFTDNSTSPTGITNWNWTFNGGTPTTSNTQGSHTITFNTAGTYTITLQVTDAAGTGDTSMVVNVLPTSAGTDIQTACTPFTWIDGITYISSTNTPIFTMVGGSAVGCDSVVALNLTITTPTKTIQTFVECQGFSITVGTNTYTSTGIYTDISNNCDTIITDLTINPAPQLTLFKTDDNCGEKIGNIVANVNSTNPPITYIWNTGVTDSIISNLPAGTYSVSVNDGSGCIKADTINVLDLQIDCDFFVYTPNAFTPNGDGNNDVFFVRGKGIETLSVKIYNRWGNKVFEINDVSQGWDGTYKGAKQNTAVFVFVLEATFLNGKTVTESGDVSLIR